MTIRAPRGLLRMDAITVRRPSTSQDAEGSAVGGRTLVFVGRGTVSTATTQDQLVAAARGTKVDQILSLELGLDVQAGDFVTDANGLSFEVMQVDPRRLYQRAIMRREV